MAKPQCKAVVCRGARPFGGFWVATEKERKKSNDAIDKLADMLGQMDTDDPEEQRAAAERIKEQIKQQEDFWDGFGVVEMDLEFTNEDGEFDQGKYDAFRDIIKESYAQQMKRLKASTRLLKRLRKDKTRIELPKLPGWQYLPGDRRICRKSRFSRTFSTVPQARTR